MLISSMRSICDRSTHTPPGERGDVTLERRPHTKRDHGDARGVAKPNDRGDFFVGLREYDDVGKCGIRQSFAVAMPFADGARGHRALAIVGSRAG